MAIGPVRALIPKVRDRAGSGGKFNSSLVPSYVCRPQKISVRLAVAVSEAEQARHRILSCGGDCLGVTSHYVADLGAPK